MIQDEYSHLNISRQRRYQLRMARDSRCTECGAPASANRCTKHLVRARERQRRKFKLNRRYRNSISYRLEKQTSTK